MQDSDLWAEYPILQLLDKPLSADELRAATELIAQPLDHAQREIAHVLLFSLGEDHMACELVDINQLLHVEPVHRIPHRTNKLVRGLANVDGELALCGDLKALLELSGDKPGDAAPDDARRMIVLGPANNRWVVEVQQVRGVAAVAREDFRPPPLTVDAARARYTRALLQVDQAVVALLDVERIVAGFQAALR